LIITLLIMIPHLLADRSLIMETPAALLSTSMASSSETSRSNSRLMDSACARMIGTRMHVAVICGEQMSGAVRNRRDYTFKSVSAAIVRQWLEDLHI
jgi:hypothetical protein